MVRKRKLPDCLWLIEDNEEMSRILIDSEHYFEEDFSFSDIEVIKSDDFVAENSFEHLDLIKLDVGGYELKVLRSAEQILKKYLSVLFLESEDDNLKAQNDSA